MPTDLNGKPIAITGASSGIGLATAFACAAAGMPVVLAARRLDKLAAAVDRIRAAGGRAEPFACDVDDPAAAAALTERTVDAFGSIYAVFANAGYGFEGGVLESDDARIEAIFRTNFWGTLHTVRPAVERMKAAGKGHVLICSSCLSKIGMPFCAAYSATKAAQDHIARGMRHELAPLGVRVSSIHPVGTRTEFFDQVAVRSAPTGRGRLTLGTPDLFMQPPERVARAVVRCLRRPRGEVWTSLPVRCLLGASVLAPGLTDALLARIVRSRLKAAARSA